MRRALETVGYEVVEAEDGLQALEIAREARALAFVISDIVLPRLKGPDLRDQVLVGRPHLPFLFISGYPDWQMAEIFHDQRGVGFLGKPFGLQALYESLGNLLGQPLEIV